MFKVGADPEVFLQETSGKFISAIRKVGGSKHAPRQLENMEAGFTVQEDNVAVEFGIPPATTKEAFILAIEAVQKKVLKELPSNLWFSELSCVSFPEEEMQDPEAFVFGCEPDYNAWTGRVNRFKPVKNPYLRSAGGHVHVSLDSKVDPNLVVKYMDLYLGIPSIVLDKNGSERRALYGKAGACRYKPYGVEYRVLSNFWIFDRPSTSWVWDATKQALEKAKEDTYEIDSLRNLIVDTINNSNHKRAEKLIKEYQLL